MHPPIALALFAPFAVLPAVLWWAIPLGILGYCVASWRPAFWTWPLLALPFCLWSTFAIVWVGNSTLWVVAMVAAGLRWGWPAALIVIKPTVLPLALVGARKKSWWVAMAAIALGSAMFGSLWIEWVAVVQNAPIGPGYNTIETVPLLLVPVIAWLGQVATTNSRTPVMVSASGLTPWMSTSRDAPS
jgi:hypothetical protein